ncbi:MAG: hypothetical protein AAF989_04425 [Planctomycetota bacterium]
MSPFHSVSHCPICGGGLCGVRLCGLPSDAVRTRLLVDPTDPPFGGEAAPPATDVTVGPHGLIVCDECEAIWCEPDTSSEHQYPDPEDPRCPICRTALFGPGNHWANRAEVAFLGWEQQIDPKLDFVDKDMDGPGSGHLNMGGEIV